MIELALWITGYLVLGVVICATVVGLFTDKGEISKDGTPEAGAFLILLWPLLVVIGLFMGLWWLVENFIRRFRVSEKEDKD